MHARNVHDGRSCILFVVVCCASCVCVVCVPAYVLFPFLSSLLDARCVYHAMSVCLFWHMDFPLLLHALHICACGVCWSAYYGLFCFLVSRDVCVGVAHGL